MNSDTPVVFLPGTLCDERIFIPLWKRMNITERAYVPLQWANNLDEMLSLTGDRVERYGQKVHLVGYSMGGFVASTYASRHADNIASLTLIGYNPTGLTDDEVAQRKATLNAIASRRYKGMNKIALARFIHSDFIDKKAVAGVVKEMESDLGHGVLKAHIESTTPRPSRLKALASCPFPIGFIAGEHDKIAPEKAIKKSVEGIPGAQLNCVSDSAHMMLLENPDRCADLLCTMLNNES